jgi:hypothetical protein
MQSHTHRHTYTNAHVVPIYKQAAGTRIDMAKAYPHRNTDLSPRFTLSRTMATDDDVVDTVAASSPLKTRCQTHLKKSTIDDDKIYRLVV